jgi:RNA polymerase sporulation-specific sigma factor
MGFGAKPHLKNLCRNNHRTKMHFRRTNRQNNEILISDPIDCDKDGNSITIADIFRDPGNTEDIAELRINQQKLYSYINQELDARERQIICKRYGLVHCGKCGIRVDKAMTQQEVAKNLRISRSYVSRIEKRALEKLKKRFTANA